MKDNEFLNCYSVLLNTLIRHGKKRKAEKILLDAFYILRDKWNVSPTHVVKLALCNVCPAIRIQTRRKGSQRIRVPIPLNSAQRMSLGSRIICETARAGKSRPMPVKLATELYNASIKEGNAFSKVQSINQEGIINQPNSHLRWF